MQLYRSTMVALLLSAMWAPDALAQVQQAPSAAAVHASSAPAPAHGLSARTLGATEAVMDYCAANDPAGVDKVRARLKLLVQGTSKQALVQLRQSDEYQGAHSAEAAFVGKVDPHNAHRICADAAAQGR